MVYTILLLVLLGMERCLGRSKGAPTTACRSLHPAHGYNPQTTTAPYELRLQERKIFSNQSVSVTISVVSGKYRFKGFILQAKATPYWQRWHQPALGSFLLSEGTRLLDCYNKEKNTITHSYAQHMEEVTVTWQPPLGYHGSVTFTGTIVATFKTFWTALSSKSLEVASID